MDQNNSDNKHLEDQSHLDDQSHLAEEPEIDEIDVGELDPDYDDEEILRFLRGEWNLSDIKLLPQETFRKYMDQVAEAPAYAPLRTPCIRLLIEARNYRKYLTREAGDPHNILFAEMQTIRADRLRERVVAMERVFSVLLACATQTTESGANQLPPDLRSALDLYLDEAKAKRWEPLTS